MALVNVSRFGHNGSNVVVDRDGVRVGVGWWRVRPAELV